MPSLLPMPVLPPPAPPPASVQLVLASGVEAQVLAQHVEAVKAGADCLRCPLYDCGEGPVHGEVVAHAPGAIVGEAPGAHEIREGRPFVGPSGTILDECLHVAGAARGAFTITNTILCRPAAAGGNLQDYVKSLRAGHELAVLRWEAGGRNGPEPAAPMLPTDCCAPRLHRELETSTSRVLIPVGNAACQAVARWAGTAFGTQKVTPGTPKVLSIKKQHGSPVPLVDGRVIFPSFHPAFALRGDNAKYMEVLKEDLVAAVRCALSGGCIEWVEPSGILDPTEDVCVNVLDILRISGARVSLDIETDGKSPHICAIRCVGLGALVDDRELAICIPWLHMGGSEWWRLAAKERIGEAVRRLLDESPLVGHNLPFDTQVLLRHGLMTDRLKRYADTLVMHHDSRWSELPHDLGSVAAQFFHCPRWKEQADTKHVEGVDDATLHRYNLADVIGTLRLLPVLAREVASAGQLEAWKTDTDLHPVFRDMGDLGLNLNEAVRRDHYGKLDRAQAKHLVELRTITGIADLNPQSPRQVARWLYATRGLVPAYDTSGEEWAEHHDIVPRDPDEAAWSLAEAGTSELALLALVDRGAPEDVQRFVDALLGFRGMAKTKSTFLGLRPDPDCRCAECRRAPGFVHDVWREKGWVLGEWRPGLPQPLAVLHPHYSTHIVPTGRPSSSEPNMFAIPERVVWDADLYRATGGDEGILNIRSMVEAPPGHVLVGADYSSVELRLYAIFAKDKLLLDAYAQGLDPHSWNYANMNGRTPAEVKAWYDHLEKPNRSKAEDKARKHARNIAKRFCIAEGTPILIRCGGATAEIPIESVRECDEVWDGVEWVHHDGVVFTGARDVIEHAGLWATPDHEIWVEDGRRMTMKLALAAELPSMQTGAGNNPLQFEPFPGRGSVVGWIRGGHRTARTYDILNAGPRHRYTAAGHLVSNCYLILYGGQWEKLWKTMSSDRNPDGSRSFPGLTPEAVWYWYNNWHESHPETRIWQHRVVDAWKDLGFCSTAIDRRKRYFLGGLDPNAMANHSIQGTSADITNHALMRIARECPHRGWSEMSGILLDLYDYIGLQVPEHRAKDALDLLERCMPWEYEGVRFPVESKIAGWTDSKGHPSRPSWDRT